MKINTLELAPGFPPGVKRLCLAFALLTATLTAYSQNVTILPSGITPLPIGYLPRLSYDAILALPSPETGDMAVDLTFKCLRFYTGARWVRLINDDDVNLPAVTAWAEGGTGADYGQTIGADGAGNVYVAGRFTGIATFENTILTSNGAEDIFIAKYSKAGALVWVSQAGGTSEDLANGIAVDYSGNAYITGRFRGTATFDTTDVISAGDSDIFIAKYNGNGVLQWVEKAGGTGGDSGNSICLDAAGNAYLTGSFWYNAAFGDTTITSAGNADIFVAKYNTSGEKQWVEKGGSAMNDLGNAIAVDAYGNVYATGYFQTTVFFSGGILATNGNSDMFIVKYNTIGKFQWAKKAGGAMTDNGYGIAVGTGGSDIYITGDFAGTADFSGASLTSAGDFDIFIAKYNLNGDLSWVRQAGGTGADTGYGIVRDANSNTYITGYFTGTANFGGIPITSIGGTDIFVAKFNTDGAIQWVQKAGTGNTEVSYGIAIDNTENIYITGYFSGSATFGNTVITSAGSVDAFIARIKE